MSKKRHKKVRKQSEYIRVKVRRDVISEASLVLEARGSTVEKAIELHLRGYINANQPPLGVDSIMNFGKYRDTQAQALSAEIDRQIETFLVAYVGLSHDTHMEGRVKHLRGKFFDGDRRSALIQWFNTTCKDTDELIKLMELSA